MRDRKSQIRNAVLSGELEATMLAYMSFSPIADIAMLSIRNLETKSKSYLIYLKELETLPIIKILKRFVSEG
ncbi:hypothetical protein ACP3V5_08130 [Vibrio maritimus]